MGRRLTSSLSLLHQNRYRRLWCAATASSLGDKLVTVALPFGILEVTHSIGALGIALTAKAAASMVCLLFSGVVADRVSRRHVMIWSDCIRGVTQLSTGLLLITHSEEVVLYALLQAIYGGAVSFFNPASTGFLPEIVPETKIQEANGLLSVSRSAVSMSGPLIAGAMLVKTGPGPVFLLDAFSFVISALFLAGMRVPAGSRPTRGEGLRAELTAGWHFVLSHRWLWVTIASFTASLLFLPTLFVLGPAVAKDHLGGAWAWAVILAVGSAGTVVGGLLAVLVKPARPLLVSYALSPLIALPFGALALSTSVIAVSVAYGICLVIISYTNALWYSILQRRVPMDRLSRVSAIDWFGSLLLEPIGYALVAPAATRFGVEATLTISGLFMLLMPFVELGVVRELRKM